jgi:hypothetical protein
MPTVRTNRGWCGPGELGTLLVVLTPAELMALADVEAEGVYLRVGEPQCRVLVEKDFPCAHPHADQVCEPETERFAPTAGYLRRKDLGLSSGATVESRTETAVR